MQEAGKSIFLVFAPVILFELFACRSIIQISNLRQKRYFSVGIFFNNHVHVYIDMYG